MKGKDCRVTSSPGSWTSGIKLGNNNTISTEDQSWLDRPRTVAQRFHGAGGQREPY